MALSDFRTKHTVASEIREILDTVRDTESARTYPYLVPALAELLRSGEPAFSKDTPEYAFRRVLLEILNRLPVSENLRPHTQTIFNCMLHVIRHDNEENGTTACKALVDIIRGYRILTEENLNEFVAIFLQVFQNMKGLVDEVLSEDSSIIDTAVLLPSIRSFKVLGEMGMVIVIMSQVHRQLVSPAMQTSIPYASEVLALESPAQHKARKDFEATGEVWSGMSSTVKNAGAYSEFIHSQIKACTHLLDGYAENLILSALRLLQDCPSNGIALRKELMVVFRHLMSTNHRRVLFDHLDKLFNERVLLGTGIASKEMLRVAVYSSVTDLVHHLRNDLTPEQLNHIVESYSCLIHNPALGNNLHTLFAKMMFGLTDAILAKETSQGAAKLLMIMFESCLERLEALATVQEQVSTLLERPKNEVTSDPDIFQIEKARPVGGATYAVDKPEDTITAIESRVIFRALLHGFRVCLASLKKCDAPIIDGTYIFRLFEGCIRCMVSLDPETRPDPRGTSEYSDTVEWFGHALLEINLHVFQEVWTHKIDFFFDCARTRIPLLNICQFLFAREQTSPTLLAIVLKYLVDRLPLLGEQDDMTAAATIRLYKMAFAAVSQYPVNNEPILAAHLSKLLMDCFPLAAKATKPTHYFHLLRALFRAIGGGGGRFELLYKEVLPLLPEMLENLNRQLLASEGIARDMIVELCLTVPLRLTHLLPHLTYLMQPLALALRGSPELVSQGLRTLELCIDNLTPDFLDPTLSTVLRELMEALFNHLKPQPASHHAAHTTIRILGKLGGRNRRLLTKEPALTYHHHSESAKMAISFGGTREKIDLGPMSRLASENLVKLSNPDREHAYHYLESCLSTIVYENIKGRNGEEIFVRTLGGIYDAVHIPELNTQAKTYIRNLSRSVFEISIRKHQSRDTKGGPNRLLFCYLDAIPEALTREQPDQAIVAQELIAKIIEDLVAMRNQSNVSVQEILLILHQMTNRFTALCLDEQWIRKSAGCSGIKLMTQTPELAQKWIGDREGELIRTLLHIFKDMPLDIPRDIDDIIDILLDVLRISNAHLDFSGEGATTTKNKLINIMGIFFPEIQNSNPIVRRAAQKCIEYLVSLSGKPAFDLLVPHRDRMLTGIYTKPLRALPFSKQIGMIEAIRYCVSLDPPLLELSEELLRLLHETLALADAEDSQLLGRGSIRQGTLEITKLRVACIKLLTASMPITDFFSRQTQTRQRVTGVYFKSLYSPSPEVKDVAHEGLRMVLTHQSRLPKELLQTGLRPILMNLADPKRLSVPGLEGLARLLELLTNYFKVEIGHKLLDHFRSVADPQMLQQSSRLPLADHEGISKLVRLANIFHLLPSAANIFLENLCNAVVQTEAQMHFSTQSPFSEPLAKYLDRYPVEGIDFFMRHLKFPQHLRTWRSIIRGKYAPNLERELASRTPLLVNFCAQGAETGLLTQALLLLHDLAEVSPNWILDYELAIDTLVKVWRSTNVQPGAPDLIQRHTLLLNIFMKALQQSPRIDLLFDIVVVFNRSLSMDMIHVSQFLYKHVALSEAMVFRRNVLLRFLTWFGDATVPWYQKGAFLRYIISPTLLVHASRGSTNERLLDADFINQIHRLIWQRIADNSAFGDTDDMFKIELLHFTTVLVQYYSDLLEDVKKDIIKCAWHYITNSDDIIVKQTAYLLAARFFAAFPTPQKFILRAWTGLLRLSHSEGKPLVRQEALATLAPVLPQSDSNEPGHPQWAKTTRRLLAEEGLAQMIAIYHLIIKQPQLFYPVRSLFVPHMANSLSKLGMSTSSTAEMRSLSIEVLQVIFDWEEQATQASQDNKSGSVWLTPISLRENMISYLVRLATFPHDQTAKATLVPRALTLLQSMVGPNGWKEVTVGLRYFSRTLEQNDLTAENALSLAIASAKVLQVITAKQSDTWFTTNATALQKLIRKGLMTEDHTLQDALYPIFDHLVRLFPLPKEEEEQQADLSDFHSFVNSTIGDGLRNNNTPRSILLMLKSVVTYTPERVEAFSQPLMKLLSKLAKEHIQSPPTNGTEGNVRLITLLLEICQISVAYLADQRRWLLSTLVVLVEKSKSIPLCQFMLRLARTWAMHRHEAYPTMKEKASLIQKMTFYETRGEPIFQEYLELIYEIYTEPILRRSDLTTRLEPAFLLGCRAKDTLLREKFIDLLDVSVPRSLFGRLTYILGVQSWEVLADHNWIYLALHLVLGSADLDAPVTTDRRQMHNDTIPVIQRPDARNVIRPLQRLLFLDHQTAHDTWCTVFPAAWSSLSRREQTDITNHMINLLSKEYHIKQAHLRPNVIQTLLTGIHGCSPALMLPPHLTKYLAKTFGAWHVALEILGSSLEMVKDDEPNIREYVYDSLADVYAELADEDMFYGLWRRRCLHQETNIAIAFSEPEYCLWEDHWVLAAEKLQQWDILYDFAKNEGNQELMLESAWRIKDWADNKDSLEEQVKQLPEIPTPRRRVFEAFLALLKFPGALDKNTEFTKVLEDAMQLSLRKWVGLPTHLSNAHVPLLQHFQQFVELQEAVQIFGSLSQTNAQNLEKKSSELKMVLQAWRERLPNIQDDINLWSDLVAWRQNVFHAINNAYMPLINNQGNNNANNNTNTYGYRGYHETAWIINRFAHVARKHDLLDVCFTSLTKIYTLPNIEISEAFLKLREQARCHYQKPNDLQAGLDVINNTNLMFFSNSQKAEFYTLKGMFHARLARHEEANHAFGQAVQLDMAQAKAWAEWGRFNDRMFKNAGTDNTDLTHASSAVSCYLQAAGLYKSGKSRPLLIRILWLLSMDDNAMTISKAFDTYKGDAAYWYWITLTPQLCQSLNHREAKQARYLLLNLARHYPQALFYPLRTYREELQLLRKTAQARAISLNQAIVDPNRRPDEPSKDGMDGNNGITTGQVSNTTTAAASTQNGQSPAEAIAAVAAAAFPRQALELVDEVLQVLKTTFPLLILSLETMVDQLHQKFKPPQEDDIYRHICLLLQEAIQNYVVRMNNAEDDGSLATHTQQTLARLAPIIGGAVRKEFEEDFLVTKPSHYEYIRRLQQWRDKYERMLDSRPRIQPLALVSHYLTEFQYNKIDEIEVPGQYTEDKDTNQNFVKIQKFAPKFELGRSNGVCWKRFTLHGNDNTKTSFTVQIPCHRQCRREDKVMQILRTFNGALQRKKETRKRNLSFHLPAAVSCSPTLRLFQTDTSYITLGDIYEFHCEDAGISREEPILFAGEKIKKTLRELKQNPSRQIHKTEYFALKNDIFDEITLKTIPDTILTNYMLRTMDGPSELWRMRRQFGSQLAAACFMTFVLCLSSRHPSRFQICRSTGQIAMTELIPSLSSQMPIFATSDVVPFRLTPNMQNFLGPICTEGILTSGILAIARSLTEPEYALEQQLCLFGRDEVISWMSMQRRPWAVGDAVFRQGVAANVDVVVKRAEILACKTERENQLQNNGTSATVPVIQTITNLVSSATNPLQLAKMGELYHPWF
ncbi:hypothetical protein AGABI2DRAFT_184795 [Agaricus bisporus var. bisporus H97]|uniref:hypothetical protein n=1 Tax=Agaricus bisporus var. bisporus (strain H97 / ATCC MYA-4626 / FGSC 10389) TaxID=936046 RepID=UPI00029F75F8|nr:hypothetical protein AGABI2DRAFT_184795 [Agaricus bisporus var. bisporus H97]EKV48441.1 hypothetical protein AGABI2DRAFT_184795 [Agaricus bisporus var. bisporus H97]